MSNALTFIMGPMRSGKTKALIELFERARERGKRISIWKPLFPQDPFPGYVKSRALEKMIPLRKDKNAEVFLIDEAQLLSLEDVVELKMRGCKHQVFCFVLSTDENGKLFPASELLFRLADRLDKRSGSCFWCCGPNALLSIGMKKDEKGISFDLTGLKPNEVFYASFCRKCFNDVTR